MTESELIMTPPAQNNQQHKQPAAASQQQQPQQKQQLPSCSSMLFQTNVRYEPPNPSVANGVLDELSANYPSASEQCNKLSDAENLQQQVNLKDVSQAGKLVKGFVCGILVDPANGGKYFDCLNNVTMLHKELWPHTDMNIIISEMYPFLRRECRQQLYYYLDEAMQRNVPKLDYSIALFCRALSDGTEFRDTSLTVHQLAQSLLSNQHWISALPRNSHSPACVFSLFSRFISDTQIVSNSGVMTAENFKQPLISVCEILVRERFPDLMLLGSDLLLALMRLAANVPQFVPIWRALLNNPDTLMQGFTGVQQLFTMATSGIMLAYRVSTRLSKKMEEIIKIQVRHAAITNAATARAQQPQMQQELNRQFDALRNMHLSGPDSASIRAEITRHLWAMLARSDSGVTMDARATLLSWLLRTAKPGSDLQWCKLVFFWEWYSFESTAQNAAMNAEPALSTLRQLFQTGHYQLCNSLIEFLIKSANMLCPQLSYFFVSNITNNLKTLELQNHPVQALFSYPKLEQPLKDQLRATFPDLFPRRITSIATNLAEPSQIIDFDAIRNTSAAPSTPTEAPVSQEEIPMKTNFLNGKTSATQPLATTAKLIKSNDGKLAATKSMDDVKRRQQPAKALASIDAFSAALSTDEPMKKKSKTDEIARDFIPAKTADALPKKRKRVRIEEDEDVPRQVAKSASMAEAEPTSTNHDDVLLLEVDEEESSQDEAGTSKRMPLAMLLPVVREEFREPLESLNRAVKKKARHEGGLEEDDTSEAIQALMDSIFDADEVDSEEKELIAVCLIRIFEPYLESENFLPEETSEEALSEIMELPIYRLFAYLCRTAEDADSRRKLLDIVAKMWEECPPIGYLFLFFTSNTDREGQSSRGNSGPNDKQALAAYRDICQVLRVDWEKQLAKDLEQCSLDDYPLYSHMLASVLARMTPYGPPAKVIRLICGTCCPRLLARLLSEIVRENVVMFLEENVLQLLTDSLKWESLEQFMLWQMVQAEPVSFDKFLEILQRLYYDQHPEATAAVMIIMRNLEPNTDMKVMMSIVRNLLMRQPNRDLFTVDAIKLLIDYDENIPSVADCISKLVRKALKQGDITAAGTNSGHPNVTKGKARVLTVDMVFAHMDRLRQSCMQKENQPVEELFKNPLMLDVMANVKKDQKLYELHSRYAELFAQFEIFWESTNKPAGMQGAKHRRIRTKATVDDMGSRDGTPTKKKKRAPHESDSDEE